ncbi:MAG: hypothetical protein ACRCUS_09435, partial [Anaerovoracaceae bacterium]
MRLLIRQLFIFVSELIGNVPAIILGISQIGLALILLASVFTTSQAYFDTIGKLTELKKYGKMY